MPKLTWDGSSEYYAKLEDGRTLYVSGDPFAEVRYEMIKTQMEEKHPELSSDALEALINGTLQDESSEASRFYDEVTEELLDASVWIDDAAEVDSDGDPIAPNNNRNYDAWIKPTS